MIPIETNYVVNSRHNSQVIRYRNNTYEISLLKKILPDSKTSDSPSSPLLSVSYRHQIQNNGLFFQAELQFILFDKDLTNLISLSIDLKMTLN